MARLSQITTGPRRPHPLLLAEVGLVGLALAAAFVSLPAGEIEQWYSVRAYPAIQHTLTPLSNGLPFAVFDVVVIVMTVAACFAVFRAARQAWHCRHVRPLLATFGHLAASGAVVYLAFLVLWGLNYRRVSIRDRLVVAAGAPRSEAVIALGLRAADRMNALHASSHQSSAEIDWRNPPLRAAFASIQRMLSAAPPAVPGRLKHSLFGPYFRWTSVDGMVNPFGLEVLANPDLLPFERPFVLAHEWSHLGGYAAEADASFVGWLTCMQADAAAQYSGWVYLYWHISGEVSATDRRRLGEALTAGPRRDVEAIVARLRRGQLPLLRNASWRIYDQYLKANRVEAGIRSYDEVVTLILQTQFDEAGVPIRRE